MKQHHSFKVFIVEDNKVYATFLRAVLENEGYTVQKFSTGIELVRALHENPDVIILDYFLPRFNGSEILYVIKQYNPDLKVIVLSEQNNPSVKLEMLDMGVFRYIPKSWQSFEEVKAALKAAQLEPVCC